jgi:hypothetical protein
MNNMLYSKYMKPLSFVDKIYSFYFFEHKKQFLFSLCIFVIALSYMSINYFMLGRSENRSLYESVFITILLTIIIPLVYCAYFYGKNRPTSNESFVFYGMFYRKTNTRLLQWERPSRGEYRKIRFDKVLRRTDPTIYSNLLHD